MSACIQSRTKGAALFKGLAPGRLLPLLFASAGGGTLAQGAIAEIELPAAAPCRTAAGESGVNDGDCSLPGGVPQGSPAAAPHATEALWVASHGRVRRIREGT